MGVLLLRELFVNKERGGCVGFIRGAEEEEDGGGGPIDPDRAEPFDRVGVMGERGGGCKAGGALDLVVCFQDRVLVGVHCERTPAVNLCGLMQWNLAVSMFCDRFTLSLSAC